jgi:hypothetical protein
MRHVWSIVSKSTAIDKESNSLSIFEIINKVDAELSSPVEETDNPTAIPLECYFTSQWALDQNEDDYLTGMAHLSLIAPDGSILLEGDVLIEMGGMRYYTLRFFFKGFPVRGSGMYLFDLSFTESGQKTSIPIAQIPFEINIRYPQLS